MRRLVSVSLAVSLIGGASFFVFRASPDRGVLFSGPVSNPTRIADLCDLVTLQGPASFCIRPDGGQPTLQVDGGATLAMTLTGGPTGHTLTQLPCGDDGCLNSSTTLTSASTYWRSAVVDPPSGSFTAIEYGTETQIGVNNASYIGNPSFLSMFNGNPYPVATVYYSDAGFSNILSGGPTMVNGAPHMIAFTYTYSGPTGNVGKLYLDGVLDATNSSLYAPLGKSPNASWGIGKNGVFQTLTGDVFGAAVTETALSDAQIQAIAQNLGAYSATTLQGSFGQAMTFTRASGASCTDSTGQSQTTLAHNRPCVTGGGVLSEPAATNQIRINETLPYFSGATGAVNVAVAPNGTMTADGVIGNAGSAAHFAYDYAASTPAGANTVSAYVKKGSARWVMMSASDYAFNYYDLDNGVVGTRTGSCSNTTITGVVGGWFRITATCTANDAMEVGPAGGDNSYLSTGDGSTIGVYVWGRQAETGVVATSYIPNPSTAAVTRAATRVSFANPLSGTTPAAFCFGGTYNVPATAADNESVVELGSFPAANTASIAVDSNRKVTLYVVNGGGARNTTTTAALSAGSHVIFGCATAAGVETIWVDGSMPAQAVSDPSGTGIITQPATAYISKGAGGYVWAAHGTISNVKILARGTP